MKAVNSMISGRKPELTRTFGRKRIESSFT